MVKMNAPRDRRKFVILFLLFLGMHFLHAEKVFMNIDPAGYGSLPLAVRNGLEIISEQEGFLLAACEEGLVDKLHTEGTAFEIIVSYEHFLKDELPPVAGGGVPLSLVVERGNQGSANMDSFHQSAALAGDVLGYVETGVNGQLPGFTFRNIHTDSTWHHFIDTDLDGDAPLYISAGETRIYYAFHYWGVSNSAMRYYCYDTVTKMTTEIENFGYGFEGFGVSDTWVMRVGSKGNGWNNQILAHNIETEASFELLADSTATSWSYNYDSFGGPKTDGNTVVFSYTDSETWTESLRVYSLGADGLYGTADDVSGSLRSGGNYNYWDVDGQYIFWVEGAADENIMAYDMGADMLYGTADDGGVFTVCDAPGRQISPKADDGIIVWQDWRNSPSNDFAAPRDIYGYDIANDTEFRSTPAVDSIMIRDFSKGRVIMNRHDWAAPAQDADIFMSRIHGRIQEEYFKIDIRETGNPVAQSLLTGTEETAPYGLGNVRAAGKGPLGALFVLVPDVGQSTLMAYSAVTGEWSYQSIAYTTFNKHFAIYMDGENGMVLANGDQNSGGTEYSAWVFNGRDGSFSPRVDIPLPTGFAVGKNTAFIWKDGTQQSWLRTYDAVRNTWTYRNDSGYYAPWRVIGTHFSDSLALLIAGEGDTVCNRVTMEMYDLTTGGWKTEYVLGSVNAELNRHTDMEKISIKINPHFAAVAVDRDAAYYDHIYIFRSGGEDWTTKDLHYRLTLDPLLMGANYLLQGAMSDGIWQGHIYNNVTGEWLEESIVNPQGIDDLFFSGELMMAWYSNTYMYAYTKIWAYSPAAEGLQELRLENGEDFIGVHAGDQAGYVIGKTASYSRNKIYTFNGQKGEWSGPLEALNYDAASAKVFASGYTGIFLARDNTTPGHYTAYGYSAFRDRWDSMTLLRADPENILTSGYCGLLIYDDNSYGQRYFHPFNAMAGKWSREALNMYPGSTGDIRLDERIILVGKKGATASHRPEVSMYSPRLDTWTTASFDFSYELEGTGTTPTSAFAWDGVQFRIIFNTENVWDSKPGALQELHVTDDAIAATLYHSSSTTTYYFYPPRNEVVDRFEFTQDPHAEILSSWEAEIRWATNKDADSYLVWGREEDDQTVHADTAEGTMVHRIRISGLDAETEYHYHVESRISGVDTLYSGALSFNTGTDHAPPVLRGVPEAYRIHDHAASVWWETNEPSTALIQWGLSTDYTDTLAYEETYLSHSLRMRDLEKDTTYHYRVGGYDRYGNGPFFSEDYTFHTRNDLPRPSNLTAMDSTVWGCAYMRWDPPQLDSSFARESFDHGIPADWRTCNKGSDPRGTTWRAGYMSGNPVAYCNYGSTGEQQEEWLITNPVNISDAAGGVLNFWHTAFYTDYDNTPNRVMISTTGTDTEDFTTIWSSQDLPEGSWKLEQIPLNFSSLEGEAVYFAFVYASTYGETWVLDDIYLDYTVDGFYEGFVDPWSDHGWTLSDDSHISFLDMGSNNYAAYMYGYNILPDNYHLMDYKLISPQIMITGSHHLLGFWHQGFYQYDDSYPNEVRILGDGFNDVVRTVFPVPSGWTWTVVDLSAYIGEIVRVNFNYKSYAGTENTPTGPHYWWGEEWYIDDIYLFENTPRAVPAGAEGMDAGGVASVTRSSSPRGKRIPLSSFSTFNKEHTAKLPVETETSPGIVMAVPEEKPERGIRLEAVTAGGAPSAFAEVQPELKGYAVYGRRTGEEDFSYLGYVTTPGFADGGTYLGFEREYYVEAYYDKGYSQPCAAAFIRGGTRLRENEYAYDTGVFGYSYWWYPGNSFSNAFYFPDSLFQPAKMKVHVERPGSFKMRLSTYDGDDALVPQFTSSVIHASERGWRTVDIPASIDAAEGFSVEFLPQDTLVALSYEYYDNGASFFYDGSEWTPAEVTLFIRLFGTVTGPVASAETNIPREYALGQNYPNPFNPVTAFDFALPEAGHTVIRVYDVRGALVNTLVSGHRDAGRYHVQWNGRDAGGNPAASGVYLIRMEAGDFRESRKMLLVR